MAFKVERLSDHLGEYTLQVRCRKCSHARKMTPHALAPLVGWNAELTNITSRLRCSNCQARSVEISVESNRPNWQQRWGKYDE